MAPNPDVIPPRRRIKGAAFDGYKDKLLRCARTEASLRASTLYKYAGFRTFLSNVSPRTVAP